MENFFSTCKTLDEAKKQYRALAMIHHPDKGGDVEVMKEIINQFEKFVPQTEKFAGETAQWNSAEFVAIINDLIHIPGIIIEITGSYISVMGETKPVKDLIKAINVDGAKYPMYSDAQWHSTHKHWFFKPAGYRPFTNKKYSMDEIRNMHGSENVKTNQRPTIAA
jgi:hypothetical protein